MNLSKQELEYEPFRIKTAEELGLPLDASWPTINQKKSDNARREACVRMGLDPETTSWEIVEDHNIRQYMDFLTRQFGLPPGTPWDKVFAHGLALTDSLMFPFEKEFKKTTDADDWRVKASIERGLDPPVTGEEITRLDIWEMQKRRNIRAGLPFDATIDMWLKSYYSEK